MPGGVAAPPASSDEPGGAIPELPVSPAGGGDRVVPGAASNPPGVPVGSRVDSAPDEPVAGGVESARTARAAPDARSRAPLDELDTASMDELTKAGDEEGDSGDGRVSGATDDSPLVPLGDFERGRASFGLASVLLAMIVASIVIAVIRLVFARRREKDEAFDQTLWVPVGRAPAEAQPGTEQHDHVAADARPGRVPSRAQASAPPMRGQPRDRAAADARPRPVPQHATRRSAARQPRPDVGGPPNAVAGANGTASRNPPVRPARVEGQVEPEQAPTNNKRQPLDRRWLTRLPVRKADQ
jgi:hypothetical protein